MRQSLKQFRTPDEFVQRGDDGGECWPVSSLLLPTIQHEIVNGLRAVHRCWQSNNLNNMSVKSYFPLFFLKIGNNKFFLTCNPFRWI